MDIADLKPWNKPGEPLRLEMLDVEDREGCLYRDVAVMPVRLQQCDRGHQLRFGRSACGLQSCQRGKVCHGGAYKRSAVHSVHSIA
jgi:hypothetical protein